MGQNTLHVARIAAGGQRPWRVYHVASDKTWESPTGSAKHLLTTAASELGLSRTMDPLGGVEIVEHGKEAGKAWRPLSEEEWGEVVNGLKPQPKPVKRRSRKAKPADDADATAESADGPDAEDSDQGQ